MYIAVHKPSPRTCRAGGRCCEQPLKYLAVVLWQGSARAHDLALKLILGAGQPREVFDPRTRLPWFSLGRYRPDQSRAPAVVKATLTGSCMWSRTIAPTTASTIAARQAMTKMRIVVSFVNLSCKVGSRSL